GAAVDGGVVFEVDGAGVAGRGVARDGAPVQGQRADAGDPPAVDGRLALRDGAVVERQRAEAEDGAAVAVVVVVGLGHAGRLAFGDHEIGDRGRDAAVDPEHARIVAAADGDVRVV